MPSYIEESRSPKRRHENPLTPLSRWSSLFRTSRVLRTSFAGSGVTRHPDEPTNEELATEPKATTHCRRIPARPIRQFSAARAAVKGAMRPTPEGLTAASGVLQSRGVGDYEQTLKLKMPSTRCSLQAQGGPPSRVRSAATQRCLAVDSRLGGGPIPTNPKRLLESRKFRARK